MRAAMAGDPCVAHHLHIIDRPRGRAEGIQKDRQGYHEPDSVQCPPEERGVREGPLLVSKLRPELSRNDDLSHGLFSGTPTVRLNISYRLAPGGGVKTQHPHTPVRPSMLPTWGKSLWRELIQCRRSLFKNDPLSLFRLNCIQIFFPPCPCLGSSTGYSYPRGQPVGLNPSSA